MTTTIQSCKATNAVKRERENERYVYTIANELRSGCIRNPFKNFIRTNTTSCNQNRNNIELCMQYLNISMKNDWKRQQNLPVHSHSCIEFINDGHSLHSAQIDTQRMFLNPHKRWKRFSLRKKKLRSRSSISCFWV